MKAERGIWFVLWVDQLILVSSARMVCPDRTEINPSGGILVEYTQINETSGGHEPERFYLAAI